MQKSSISIHITRDYSIFKNQQGNRAVTNAGLTKVENKILKENLLKYHPILVNQDMEVIDGQHRLKVAKKHNFVISFIVIGDGANLSTTQSINTTGKAWTVKDFLNSYYELGEYNYCKFKKVLETYEFLTVSQLIRICQNHSRHYTSTELFNNGELNIDRLPKAEIVLKRMALYKKINNGFFIKNSTFQQFMIMADRRGILFNDDRMVKRIVANIAMFSIMPTSSILLSDILGKLYNHNLKAGNCLDFNMREIK